MGWVDSALFAALAEHGGLLHPPGFPGYYWISRLTALAPAGVPAWKTNLLSAIFAAGGVWLVAHIAACLFRNPQAFDGTGTRPGGQDDQAPGDETGSKAGNDEFSLACSAAAALSLGFSYSWWSQAVHAEQFTYTAFFCLLTLLLLLRAVESLQRFPGDPARFPY